MDLSFAISAFVAGLLTFLAPCTLPLVPAYLGFVSGVSQKELKNPETASFAKRKILLNGIFFILGFSVVFILFGTLAGFLGAGLAPFRIWLGRIGGAAVILFGLFMLGAVNINFLKAERRMKAPSFLKLGKPTSSFAVGSAFAFGWTPCVGPILGSILLFASTSGTVAQGALLLAIFSLGLAIPFIAITIGISKASQHINNMFAFIKRYRVIILSVFGLAIGFLANLVILGFAGLGIMFAGISSALRTIGETLIMNYIYLLPIVTAALLGGIGYKKSEIDTLSVVGGLFLIMLGLLLLTNSFGLVIQYGYEIFDFINYEGLLDYL